MTKRLKKRYIAFSSDPKASPDALFRAIKSSYQELFGVLGASYAHLKLVKTYADKGVAVVHCALEKVPHLILSAAAITHLNGERVAVRIVTISGTMKGIKEKLRKKVD